jgi:uncharacterized protein Yka (UPF0111/DUF47 family)
MAAKLPWFLAGQPDVLGLLDEQAEVTVEGMRAFAAWSAGGSADDAQRVRDCEHRADDARRALSHALRTALVTPLEPEDLYTMSERIDVVINGAKNTVRDAEALGWQPDQAAAAMAALLLEGTEHLAAAIACIKSDADEASQRADAATKTARKVERGYRDAMVVLRNQPEDGALALITAYEAYGRYLAIGDAMVGVAHRIWYAVLKEA